MAEHNVHPESKPDCRAFLNRVLQSEKGCKVTLQSPGHAVNFRQRCYAMRDAVRRRNRKVYPDDHPMHGLSDYDKIYLYVQGPCVVGLGNVEAAENYLDIEDLL